MVDLDQTTLKETKYIANKYLNRFKLQGYLILRSSQNNYHIIFNRYLTWKKTIECLFKIVWKYHYYYHQEKPHLTSWAILQICKGSLTLRISAKQNKHKPTIMCSCGLSDKLISDYLAYYNVE